MIINYLLTIILLMVLAGMGIDIGLMEFHQFQLQTVAQAMAVTMTMAMQRGLVTAGTASAAGNVTANLNGLQTGVNGVTISYPATTAPSARVVITQTVHNTFLTLVGNGTSNIRADVTAPGATQVTTANMNFNKYVLYTDGHATKNDGTDMGLSGNGFGFSATALSPASGLGAILSWRGCLFFLGLPNVADATADASITLPAGSYSQLLFLAAAGYGWDAVNVPFTVTYTDSSTLTKNFTMTDWCGPLTHNPGEDPVAFMPYRLWRTGANDSQTIYIFGYSINLDKNKTVKSFYVPSGPGGSIVRTLAVDLVP